MKKLKTRKHFTLLLVSLFILIIGCGKEAVSEEAVGMANPWSDCSEEEAASVCPRLFKAPAGASDIKWSKMEDQAEGKGILFQLSFTLNGNEFCARAQCGAAETDEIHGLYYDWNVTDDCTLANWGEGHMQGKTYRYIDDNNTVDLITWYDIEIGIAYSLSVSAPDLDGFDIQAIAEQMYNADNEPVEP